MKEGDIVRGCQQALRDAGWICWRSQTGYFRGAGGGFYPTGVKGLADLCAIIPPKGRLLLIECKTITGKLSSDQDRFLEMAANQGAFCVVVKDVGQLKWIIHELKQNPELQAEDL